MTRGLTITNYVTLGRRGFDALTSLVTDVPAKAIDYASSEEAIALVESLWTDAR